MAVPERLAYRPALDGLRAFAAGAVVLFHVTSVGDGGYIGVDFFFVLSGFLITTLLWHDHTVGSADLRTFYRRRLVRLAPVLLLVVAAAVVATALGAFDRSRSTETLWGALGAVTYSSAWIRSYSDHILGWLAHTWSLSVEEWFYVVWPVAFGLLWTADTRALVRRIAFLYLASIGYRVVAIAAGFADGWRLYNGPDFRAEQLLAGCLLAVVLVERAPLVRGWLGFVGGGGLLAYVFLGPDDFTHVIYQRGGSSLVAIASVALIAAIHQNPTARVVAGPLSHPTLVWLGQRSYGIYLWHYLIYGLVRSTSLPRPWVSAPVIVVVSIALAAGSYRYVEMPVRARYGRRGSPRRRRSLTRW